MASGAGTGVVVTVAGHVPVTVSEANGHARSEAVVRPGPAITVEQARANLLEDARAAEAATPIEPNGRETPMEHVLNEAEACVSDEGENLLKDGT